MADRPLQRGMARRAHTEYLVRPVTDRGELRSMLAPHRAYAAYALGQLQPHLFGRSEWLMARGAHGQALLLHSRGGLGNALFALGGPEALEALLRLHPGSSHTFLTCQPQHLEPVLRHFGLSDRQTMSRMLVNRETFQPSHGPIRRLTGRDVRRINRLYRADGTPAFYSAQNIDDAIYYGAFDEDQLVAVAGTHVVSIEDSIAVVGNVYTHPGVRGRGLGRLVTGAVTRELLASGCRDIVLSVDPRNAPAVRAYQKLGYREVDRIIEGAASRRDIGLEAWLRRRVAAMRGRRYGAELVNVPL